MTILTALQNWFQRQCNREWERTYGVSIQIADNPGWWVTIDLRGTALEGKPFEPGVPRCFHGRRPTAALAPLARQGGRIPRRG
jgi:hypothetical protein